MAKAPNIVLGKHHLIDFYNCEVNDLEAHEVGNILSDAAVAGGATPIQCHMRPFIPQGLSGIVILQESHITVHTWPEVQAMAFDVFTCGRVDNQLIVDHLVSKFKPGRVTEHTLDRLVMGSEHAQALGRDKQ